MARFSDDSVFTTVDDFGAKTKGNFHKDIDSIIIVKAPRSSSLVMYRSIMILGGTRSNPANKHVEILVFGSEATAVIFNKDYIVGNV